MLPVFRGNIPNGAMPMLERPPRPGSGFRREEVTPPATPLTPPNRRERDTRSPAMDLVARVGGSLFTTLLYLKTIFFLTRVLNCKCTTGYTISKPKRYSFNTYVQYYAISLFVHVLYIGTVLTTTEVNMHNYD